MFTKSGGASAGKLALPVSRAAMAAMCSVFTSIAITGCDNGGSSTSNATVSNTEAAATVVGGVPATSSFMQNFSVLNGFGVPLLPHRIAVPDSSGNATPQVVEIRSLKTLVDNKPSATNPILPVATWPATAILPSQAPGNHFLLMKFGAKFKPAEKSILDPLSPTGLTGALTVTAQDPVTGVQTLIPGRMFVNGRTTRNGKIETWVKKGFKVNTDLEKKTKLVPLPGFQIPVALQDKIRKGFPGIKDVAFGVDNSFSGSKDLMGPGSVVFIPDADDDLSTFETFPANKNIRVSVGEGVRSTGGAYWPSEAVAVSVVGQDLLTPEILVNPGSFTPVIDPALASSQVPVDKKVAISFTEPVQPWSVGPLPSVLPPPVAGGVTLAFTIGQKTVSIPFSVLPESAYNFTKMVLTPAFQFPGSYLENGPNGLASSNDVVFTINIGITTIGSIHDLGTATNTIPRASSFTTGLGVGIVNAPVAPEAIYLGFGGQKPGIGVLDIDGFGQGTGTPIQDNPQTLAIEPNTTNFPNNPDLLIGSAPPLAVDNTSLAGGSLGPLTLTRDTSTVNFIFAQPPILGGVRDMAIGGPLDQVFNNGVCTSGGGNYCAKDIFHATSGNPINLSPAPNPPRLVFPPLCLAPLIGSEEPHSGSNLKSGNFLGDPKNGIPPQGLFGDGITYGAGPSPPPVQLPVTCGAYSMRQQIGHFLYVIDPVVRRIVVLNSNRMTLIASIPQPDPVDLAMAPDLKILAVSNFSTNQVQFINTDPLSTDFHKVVQTTNVGLGPLGICYEPDGEDVFVANSLSNTLSVLNGQNRKVRKTVSNQLNQPFQVACTPRQLNFGFNTGVYFGYVLNKNGTVATYESGPSGTQGIGFDDLVGVVTDTFSTPTAMQTDIRNLQSAVWILHRNSVGQPVASNLALAESPTGPLPFVNFFFFPVPSFRNRTWKVVQTVAPDQISGFAPRDVAFDDTNNIGGGAIGLLISETGAAGPVVQHSSKSQVRPIPGGFTNVSTPKSMFLANFDTGKIDVISLSTLQKIINPIDAPGISAMCSYWRE
ncbi:MAG: YncE family protein [Planctomycetes bacterium]|nr:YncE family protein [Planctomycetota bacterium]